MKLESISGGGKVLWGGKLPSLEALTIAGMAAASMLMGEMFLASPNFPFCPVFFLDLDEVFRPGTVGKAASSSKS
jgi:hypothetical protein